MCKLKIAIYVICVKYSLHFTKKLFISREISPNFIECFYKMLIHIIFFIKFVSENAFVFYFPLISSRSEIFISYSREDRST